MQLRPVGYLHHLRVNNCGTSEKHLSNKDKELDMLTCEQLGNLTCVQLGKLTCVQLGKLTLRKNKLLYLMFESGVHVV